MASASALPAQLGPEDRAYSYTVKMTCGGCSGAIDRVLKKNIQEPNAYRVNLEKQRVLVWGPKSSLPEYDDVTSKIVKTGKEIQEKEVLEGGAALPEV